ncbi:hypothetical protein H632_c4116p0, partial [Helicosporidium sp. ATCC 50920]
CLPRVGAEANSVRAAKEKSSRELAGEVEVAGNKPPTSTLPTLDSLFPVVSAHPRVEALRERCEAVLGGLQEQAARELGRWEEFLALAGDGGGGTPREASSPRTSQSLREEAQATVETLERLREAQARLQAMEAAVQVGGLLLECRALKQALLTAGTKKTYALLRKLQGLVREGAGVVAAGSETRDVKLVPRNASRWLFGRSLMAANGRNACSPAPCNSRLTSIPS